MSTTYSATTLLCISSRFKGVDFITEAKRLGCSIYLITDIANREKAWPRELLSDIYFVDEQSETWNIPNLIKAVSYLARTTHFDKIIPLDDFDFDKAAALREHLRVPGMGESRVRFFRDKLAIRDKAEEDDILVPEYAHVLNYERIKAFTSMVPAPWVIKPRFKDGSALYSRATDMNELWKIILDLGDDQSYYILERFIPGEIYHVDSIVHNHEICYSGVHHYGRPLMEVVQNGGLFTSATVEVGSSIEQDLLRLNTKIVQSMGLKYGVMNTEFIKSHQDGRYYFIKSSGKVGGNYLAELVESSTGLNLWREWAKIEMSEVDEIDYTCPEYVKQPAMVIRVPAKNPSALSNTMQHAAIVWRQVSHNHVTVVIRCKNHDDLNTVKDEILNSIEAL